jgi:conjugal transfer pilus assembly protein TraE
MKIVNEQRGSSIAQFFTIQTMELDTKNLRSTVTGDLHTIVGNKVVSSERRSFRFDWQYSGLSLKLVGFGMVTTGRKGSVMSVYIIGSAAPAQSSCRAIIAS